MPPRLYSPPLQVTGLAGSRQWEPAGQREHVVSPAELVFPGTQNNNTVSTI